nr:E3 ubiquitin-protein ligase znrf2 isoform X3 [Halyomorpha halys]
MNRRNTIRSLKVYKSKRRMYPYEKSESGIKCPVCSKFILPDDIECHLVMCLTKPRLIYNEDVLKEDKGECVICLEELTQGDTIARLPCLCIYHKSCIDRWFEVNRSCPEHPGD